MFPEIPLGYNYTMIWYNDCERISETTDFSLRGLSVHSCPVAKMYDGENWGLWLRTPLLSCLFGLCRMPGLNQSSCFSLAFAAMQPSASFLSKLYPQPIGSAPMRTISIRWKVLSPTIPARHLSTRRCSFAAEYCWSWIRMPHHFLESGAVLKSPSQSST